MRRESDRHEGARTGIGRRARDRLLAGETHPSPTITGRHDLENQVLFLSEDLRESALALSAIEGFLLGAQRVMEKPNVSPDELARIVNDADIEHRIDLLTDALESLRRSMLQIQRGLGRH